MSQAKARKMASSSRGRTGEPAGPRGRGLVLSRGVLALILAAVAGAIVSGYAGQGWIFAWALVLTDGLIALLWTIAATMLGAVVLRWGGIKAEGALMVACSGALGLGLTSLAALGLGLAGWLNHATTLGLGAAGVVLWLGDLALRGGNRALEEGMDAARQWLRSRPASLWPWLVAAGFLGLAILVASLPPGSLWVDDPVPYDVLEYHLQVPREWYEAGRITQPLHNVYGYFPFNVEMQYLLAMHLTGGPWKGMYVAHYLTLAHMVLSVVAVYDVVRSTLPASWAQRGAAMAAVAMAAVPWITMLASVAYNEAGLILYGTLAIGWAMMAMREPSQCRGGRMRAMALAGAMAGLACGTKYTAVPMLLVAVPAMIMAIAGVRWAWKRFSLLRAVPGETATSSLSQPSSKEEGACTIRAAMGGCAVFIMSAVLLFSPWLLRNWRWTGNPVFPEAMTLLGRGHFSEQQAQRWELAHGPRADQRPLTRRIKALGREVGTDWRYGYLFWPLAVGGLVIGRHRREVWFLGGMLATLALFWLSMTHLQSRFFVLGVPLAAMLIGHLGAGRATAWTASAMLVALAATGWAGLHLAAGRSLEPFRTDQARFGIMDLSILLDERAELMRNGHNLALVGDAKAFLYTAPMSRLQYRTVFDVDAKPGQDPLDAWLGPEAAAVKRDCHIVIDPGELRRFHATYAHVPLREEWKTATGTVVIPPGMAGR